MIGQSIVASSTVQKSGLPYGWGRFYAAVQIVAGSFLLLWLLLLWNQLYPSVRRMMIIGVAVGLPLGYGLWKRTRWALYLLTMVFVAEVGFWMMGFRHSHFRPVLAFYLHALMMYYCWKRQPDFT